MYTGTKYQNIKEGVAPHSTFRISFNRSEVLKDILWFWNTNILNTNILIIVNYQIRFLPELYQIHISKREKIYQEYR